MAPSSSSTRKAARLAQKGKGKRVRFQGGTLFPLVVSIVLVVGLALIVYARASRPEANAEAPQPGIDHWHSAYAFQLCSDTADVVLSGALEERDSRGTLVSRDFATTGIHSHDDGVIHWHPYSQRGAGSRARLQVFLDNYGVELTDDKLVLPEGGLMYESTGLPVDADFPLEYIDGETKCGDEVGTLQVVRWDSYTNSTNDADRFLTDAGTIKAIDGEVVTIAFVPDDVDVVMPAWAKDLPALGAADGGNVTQGSAPEVADDTEPTAESEPTEGTDVVGSEPVPGSTEAGSR